MLKILAVLVLVMLVSGCNSTASPDQVTGQTAEKPTMENVEWAGTGGCTPACAFGYSCISDRCVKIKFVK